MNLVFRFLCKELVIILMLLICKTNSWAQLYPAPLPEDSSEYGKSLQRTMHLLASSTPTHKNTVKILVYGQSISHGTWWLKLRDSLKLKFPNANIIMENKAIGGFASQLLFRPMPNDILPFNYDLVLFHVYGSQFQYDSIIKNIRTYTTAEVALQNDHGIRGTDKWSDFFSFEFIPKIARKYNAEYMDIRTPWKSYVDTNSITHGHLTTDGTHLNEYGSYLLSQLIGRHLEYKPKFKTDPDKLLTTYEIGKDISFINNKLSLTFEGTRVEFVSNKPPTRFASKVNILIDGKNPTEHLGCSFHLRANDSTKVSGYYTLNPQGGKRIDWPWQVGTILQIKRGALLENEDWTITINNLVKTTSTCKFDFTLSGSITGSDGGGSVSMIRKQTDSSVYDWVGTSIPFISNSKKVIINSTNWYIPQAMSNKYLLEPITNGYQIHWQSVVQAINSFEAPYKYSNFNNDTTTLIAHGLAKGSHILELNTDNSEWADITAIKIYNPYYDRPIVTSLTKKEDIKHFNLFPNPATNQITIDCKEYAHKSIAFYVHDSQGNMLREYTNVGNEKLTINTSELLPGMYYLTTTMDDQKFINKFSVIK